MKAMSGLALLGISASAACLAAGVSPSSYDIWSSSKTKTDSATTSSNSDFSPDHMFPRSKWNCNWDSRDPRSLVDGQKFDDADVGTKEDMLRKVIPTAKRHIFLIRHGQYEMDTQKQNLTPLGREQATMLGKRLAQKGLEFDTLTVSPMERAAETAAVMLEEMKPIASKVDSLLEEGAPYPPEPPINDWQPNSNEFFVEGSRIEAAFRKYIHRANPEQKADSYEMIVCHANVIRYFICRALQFPPEGWLRMSLGNCSISWLTIYPSGNICLRSIGAVGHISLDKVTFN